MGKKKLVKISPPEKILLVADLLPGDVVGVRGHTWLAKKIRYFMRLQAKKKYGVKLDIALNHTFTVIYPDEDITIGESIAKGFRMHSLWSRYKKSNVRKMRVFRLKKPLDYEEMAEIQGLALDLHNDRVSYEFLNFLWWAVYVVSNGKIDLSPKGDKQDDKLFCFEASSMLLDAARELFDDPSKVSTVDYQMSELFDTYKLV